MHAVKVNWVGQTFALAKCSDSGGKKNRSRKTREEKKTMAEVFVKKYQASNNGNFPSINLTHKEVGGSFYTVREIVREIIQENRVLGPAISPSDNQNNDQFAKPQSPLYLSSTFGPEIQSSPNDILFLANEATAEKSAVKIHEMIKSEVQEILSLPYTDISDSQPKHEKPNDRSLLKNGTDMLPVNGLDSAVTVTPPLILTTGNDNNVFPNFEITASEVVEDSITTETSNMSFQMWDQTSTDANQICFSYEKSEEVQTATQCFEGKPTNGFSEKVEEDLSAFDGKGTENIANQLGESPDFSSNERSQTHETSGILEDTHQNQLVTGVEVQPTQALNGALTANIVVDGATTRYSISPVTEKTDQIEIEAHLHENTNTKIEIDSTSDGTSSGSPEKMEGSAKAEEINPVWAVIKSFFTAVVKFWTE